MFVVCKNGLIRFMLLAIYFQKDFILPFEEVCLMVLLKCCPNVLKNQKDQRNLELLIKYFPGTYRQLYITTKNVTFSCYENVFLKKKKLILMIAYLNALKLVAVSLRTLNHFRHSHLSTSLQQSIGRGVLCSGEA